LNNTGSLACLLFSSINYFVICKKIFSNIRSQNRVVHLYQVFDGCRQWLSHVTRHELEQFTLIAGAEHQAEPDEQKPNEATKTFTRQPKLRNAKENAECIESWTVDA
jgi:hypothetical protein